MPRLTFADIKASRIPEILNLDPDDTRLASYVNDATQRLLTRGKWWGTFAKYRICASGSCITLPKQIAAVEAVMIQGVPRPVHDQWFEFLENGYGSRGDNSGIPEAIYRGHFPTFSDIVGLDKRVRVVCDLAADAAKEVLVLGYDENGNWIRTDDGTGTMRDGEAIALAVSPGTNSTTLFSAITDLQLPDDLEGQIWIYEYDTTLTTQRLIGQYHYYDTRPSFPRWFFPELQNTATTDNPVMVEIMAKLDFVPVKNDTDYCILGNLPALKLACMAIKAEEEYRFQEYEYLMNGRESSMGREGGAIQELQRELDHYQGSGRTIGITVVGSSVGEVQPIENLL